MQIFAVSGFINKSEIRKVREILESDQRREEMVYRNYEIAERHYSYEFLRRRLNFLLTNFFGTDV